MTTKTLELNNIEQKIFWILASLLGLAAAFFMYSAFSLTIAGVDRNNLTQAAHALANITGNLEAEYLAQTNGVTLAYAEGRGFQEVKAKFTGSYAIASVAAADTSAKLSMAR